MTHTHTHIYIYIVKKWAIASLSTLALLAGASHADSWGQYEKVRAPYFPDHQSVDHQPGFDQHGPEKLPMPRASYNIDSRQQHQKQQIMNGLNSGKLSRRESRDLILEHQETERMQHYYLADGRLDRFEWRQLDRRLDQTEDAIQARMHSKNWR